MLILIASPNDKIIKIPASFFSRIFRQSDSAFRADQFSIFVEKLRKNLYSFTFDILSLWRSSEKNWILILGPFSMLLCRCVCAFKFIQSTNGKSFFVRSKINSIYEKVSSLAVIIEQLATFSQQALLIILNCNPFSAHQTQTTVLLIAP